MYTCFESNIYWVLNSLAFLLLTLALLTSYGLMTLYYLSSFIFYFSKVTKCLYSGLKCPYNKFIPNPHKYLTALTNYKIGQEPKLPEKN